MVLHLKRVFGCKELMYSMDSSVGNDYLNLETIGDNVISSHYGEEMLEQEDEGNHWTGDLARERSTLKRQIEEDFTKLNRILEDLGQGVLVGYEEDIEEISSMFDEDDSNIDKDIVTTESATDSTLTRHNNPQLQCQLILNSIGDDIGHMKRFMTQLVPKITRITRNTQKISKDISIQNETTRDITLI